MKERPYKVYRIEKGTVIDHIPRAKGIKVIEVLGLDKEKNKEFVALGTNLKSKKHGYKDIVKIENVELKKGELDRIALLAPIATINIIRNSKIHKKYNVNIPNNINGIIKCSNQNCITNNEPNMITKFYLVEKSPLKVRCHYCERAMRTEDIVLL